MRGVIGWLRRVIGASGPRRGSDFRDVAKRVLRVPEAEMVVVDAALAGGGPLASRIIRQLSEAPHVWRAIGEDGGYELRISTIDPLRIRDVPRQGWTSRWIPIATDAGRQLELQLVTHQAGIVTLVGRTGDGQPWPTTWVVAPDDVERVRSQAPWIALPSPSDLRAARAAASETIAAWLGQADVLRGRRGSVQANPPASEETVDAFAAREEFALPADYRSLLLVADGIEVGKHVVGGTADAYRLDIPGPARLVIGPPNEDGALTIAESGAVVYVDIGGKTSQGRLIAPGLRQWLIRMLRRRTRPRPETDQVG